MAKIKICGLRREEDVSFVNELKPDFAGFILTKGFRRSIDFDTLIHLRKKLSADIKAVGVFVNEDLQFVKDCVKMQAVDIVQLHGDEDVDYIKQIDALAVKVLKPKDFHKIKEYEPYVDYFLFDSGTGTGEVFDWANIPKTEKPFFLAGGISRENLSTAIHDIKPYAVDMSSSVETDGYKDYNKIKEVIDIVRSITNE